MLLWRLFLPTLLAAERRITLLYPSYFTLQVRWLRSLTRITYLSKLIGINESHPEIHPTGQRKRCAKRKRFVLQLELFRVY